MPRKKRGQTTGQTFADMIAEETSKPIEDPQDLRYVNRIMDHDVWDDSGRHWMLARVLKRAEAPKLAGDPAVKFGVVWSGGRTLEWLDQEARLAQWRDRIEPWLIEYGEPLDRGPDGLAYGAQLWTRRDGSRLLLIQTFC